MQRRPTARIVFPIPRRLLPTPHLELRSITQVHHQTPLIALPRRLEQTHNTLINLDNRTTPCIAHALLHSTSIRHDYIYGVLQPRLNNRLKPLHPVRNSRNVRLIRVAHEFFRCKMAQPRHRDAEQATLVRQSRGCELVGVPRRGELVRVDVHADAQRYVA